MNVDGEKHTKHNHNIVSYCCYWL